MVFGGLVGGKDYSGGQEKDWVVRLEGNLPVIRIKLEGWRKLHRRSGDGLDGSRRGQSHSCRSGVTWRAVEQQSDTRRPRQHHPPSAPLRGGGEGGGGVGR